MKYREHEHVLAVVGNGLCAAGSAERIDAATRVVRFGHAAGFGDYSGNRVDDLTVPNRGVAAATLLDEIDAGLSPALEAARRIVLPLNPQSIFLAPTTDLQPMDRCSGLDERDFSYEVRARLCTSCRAVTCIDASVHEQACRELGLSIGLRARQRVGHQLPGGAFVALYWYVQGLPRNWWIELHGCADGIDPASAACSAELDWIRDLERSGRASVVPASSQRAA